MSALYANWDRFRQDARFGWRMLAARPGFSAVAILSIALGIGATTGIFSVIYAVLVDPYPYRNADRIGWLFTPTPNGAQWQLNYSPQQYLELEGRVRTMEDQIGIVRHGAVLSGKNILPEVVRQEDCTYNFFDFFGVAPEFGRVFTAKDFSVDGEPERVAVISYKFWQRTFQGDRGVLGRRIFLGSKEYTIVAVMPVRFTWHDSDVYTPVRAGTSVQDYVDIYYRVRPGVTPVQITAEFDPIFREFRRHVPAYFYPEGSVRPEWVSIHDGVLGKFATTLLVLFGAVLLLLLIGCGNVANLLLARAAVRQSEIAIRVSIGATRGRLIQQMLTESVMLAVSGGVAGIALAFLAIRVVVALMPEHAIPHEAAVAVNWPVLCFAVGLSILTGVIFGLAPALHASGGSQATVLKSASKASGISGSRKRLQNLLMIFEVTLSIVLLTGAGLAVKGLVLLQQKRLGYDPGHTLTFRVQILEGKYTQWAGQRDFYERLLESFSRYPGVVDTAVSLSGTPPWNGSGSKLILDDRPASEAVIGRVNLVSSRFLQMLHVPLLRGRLLDQDDIVRANRVAVISQDFAARCFPNKDPKGRHIEIDLFNQTLPKLMYKAPQYRNSFEIVGVVGTAINRGLREQPEPAVFMPYTVLTSPYNAMFVRTSGDPVKFVNQAREVVKSVDASAPIVSPLTLQEWLDAGTAYPRFSTFLFGVFGGVGMLLAAGGVFSVVSYSVAQHTREFGLRMALGAQPGDVLRLVVASTCRVVIIGLSVGVVLSVFASRALENRMEGMGSADTFLFVAISLTLMLVALAACLLPARSASLIAPVDALRYD
ncbi:MAG: ABC transporter permease [Acidobacteriaceae bacterium]|nr:ABC transporter permease [Acidobacteriaceae bacterium]